MVAFILTNQYLENQLIQGDIKFFPSILSFEILCCILKHFSYTLSKVMYRIKRLNLGLKRKFFFYYSVFFSSVNLRILLPKIFLKHLNYEAYFA